MTYYNSKKVNTSFEKTLERVGEELQKEGFGILTEIDVKATLKKKLDIEFRNYRILGACNPNFAYRALQLEENIGVMLPCNVIVQEKDDKSVIVSVIDPLAAMFSVGNPMLNKVAEAVSDKLDSVLKNL
jgi:uncharacterized protein (DUF302 family)